MTHWSSTAVLRIYLTIANVSKNLEARGAIITQGFSDGRNAFICGAGRITAKCQTPAGVCGTRVSIVWHIVMLHSCPAQFLQYLCSINAVKRQYFVGIYGYI